MRLAIACRDSSDRAMPPSQVARQSDRVSFPKEATSKLGGIIYTVTRAIGNQSDHPCPLFFFQFIDQSV